MEPSVRWLQPTDRRGRRAVIWRYIQATLFVVAALAISIPVHYVIEAENLVMLFLTAVVAAAAFLGRGPAILASVLSVLFFDLFLVEPRLSLTVADTQYLLTFFGLLAVGLVISTIVAQLGSQVEATRQREAHTAALNSLSQDLTGAVNLEEMLRSVVHHIHQSFGGRVVVLLPAENGLRAAADSTALANQHEQKELDEAEYQAAEQVYRQSGPQVVPKDRGSRLAYLGLRTSLGTVGVLGIDPGADGHPLESEARRSLLQGFANLAALAIERNHLAEQASQSQVLKNTERLQAALLNSISHELRTPLVSITGALSTLAEALDTPSKHILGDAARRELVETAYEEARRMNRLVGNLLDMSRLESGALRLTLEPCDLEDLVGISLNRFSERNRERVVETHLEDHLPLIDLDVALMVEVLANLLENAAKYSPKDSPILLTGKLDQDSFVIEVRDQGEGVPAEDLKHIFDKFYRSARVRNVGGLGLGLSISKGIVEAHGGQIHAHNQPGGGLAMEIRLPYPSEEEPK